MVLRENTPGATTRKGAIRIAMERRLEAARAEGVRSLILRAGDSLVHGEVIGRRLVTEASAQFVRESNTPWRADVSCSPAMAPSLRARWMVYGATPRMAAAFLIVINSPLAGSDDGRKRGIFQ
jgi:hypothetical protein